MASKKKWLSRFIENALSNAAGSILAIFLITGFAFSGQSFISFLNSDIYFPVYGLIILGVIYLILLKILNYIRKKRQPSPVTILRENYKNFKGNWTFQYFESIADKCNTAINLDDENKNVVNYYIAEGIIIETFMGGGVYRLSSTGKAFFNFYHIDRNRNN